ncbi:MAG: 2-amino-4-hydroxy-6-hydroxymethyldihydropteridine diphosphokinase [Pseudomonadota bacterium]
MKPPHAPRAAGQASCLIALGSNLGCRLSNLRSAVAELHSDGDVSVRAVSKLYQTSPIGGPEDQGAFLNAALLAETRLAPDELLARLHRIEDARGRKREVHWGPRTLDLDLLTYGDLTMDTSELSLPHPRLHVRRFVLVPVCDIAPELTHARTGRTMHDHLADLPAVDGDLSVYAASWCEPDQPTA